MADGELIRTLERETAMPHGDPGPTSPCQGGGGCLGYGGTGAGGAASKGSEGK